MDSIIRSVKMLSQIVELLVGANLTTPVEKVMSEFPDIRRLY
jgi:hypothetical protein